MTFQKFVAFFKNRKDLGFALLLFALAFVQYGNTIGHGYAWDDDIVIAQNERVQKGFVDMGAHFKKYNSDKLIDHYGYRPIALLSFALEWGFFSKQNEDGSTSGNPHMGHVLNIILFGFTCIAVYFALVQVFPGQQKIFAFLVALLFLVHPIHVEAVANIKSRDEILALLFSLLALISFIQFYATLKWYKYIFFILFFVIGFLSKEGAATFLFIFPLALLLRKEGTLKRKIAVSAALPVLIVGAMITIQLSQSSTLGVEETVGAGIFHEHEMLGNNLRQYHLQSERSATSLMILQKYLKNFAIPYPLTFYYGYNMMPITNWGNPWVYLSLLLHLLLGGLGIYGFWKDRRITFAIFYYFITISLYSQMVRILSDSVADRFLFTPSVGLCALMVLFLAYLFRQNFEKDAKNEKVKTKGILGLNIPFAITIAALCIAFSIMTFQRNKVWESNWTLFSTDVKNLDNCARAHFYYAGELVRKNMRSPNESLKAEIIKEYSRAIELSDSMYYARLELGQFFMQYKSFDEAAKVLKRTVELFGHQSRPHYHLGHCLLQMGEYKAAIPELEMAMKLAPKREDTYYFLGLAYHNAQRPQDGINLLENRIIYLNEKIVELAEDEYKQQQKYALGLIMMKYYDTVADIQFFTDHFDLAVASLVRVFEHDPMHLQAYQKLILLHQNKGDDEGAAKYYEEATAKGLVL